MTNYERIKMICATLTLIAPIRIFIIFGLLITGIALISLLPASDYNAPSTRITQVSRVICKSLVRLGTRLILFVAGFVYVPTVGKYDRRARIMVATHHSLWDSLWLIWYTGASQTAKADLFNSPIIGKFLQALESVPVDRHTSTGRRVAANEIRDRATCDSAPPLLIFPTACCSNCRQLIEFKRGAFSSPVPIQPVGISYLGRNADLCLSSSVWFDLYRTVSQVYNQMAVTFLPVRYPSDIESKNPKLWAGNVRREMGLMLGMQLVDYSLETEMIRVRCREAGIELNELNCRVLDLALAHRLVDVFRELDRDRDGVLSIIDIKHYMTEPEFRRILGILKLPRVPLARYRSNVIQDQAWTEEGWMGRLTGGRPALPKRPVDLYHPLAIEFSEVLSYFNKVSDMKVIPDPLLVDLFRVSDLM